MLIKSKKIGVVPITTHINLREVPKKISRKLISDKITSLNINYKKLFKKKPKIGVLGINPHNAELKKNSEEKNNYSFYFKIKKKGNKYKRSISFRYGLY